MTSFNQGLSLDFLQNISRDKRLVSVPEQGKEDCPKCTSCKLFYLLLTDIGNPPQRIPIIDGGEGTPKLVIIGQDFIPATEDLRGKPF